MHLNNVVTSLNKRDLTDFEICEVNDVLDFGKLLNTYFSISKIARLLFLITNFDFKTFLFKAFRQKTKRSTTREYNNTLRINPPTIL